MKRFRQHAKNWIRTENGLCNWFGRVAILAFLVLFFNITTSLAAKDSGMGDFFVRPYLQLGNNQSDHSKMELLWRTADSDANWSIQVQPDVDKKTYYTLLPTAVRVVRPPTTTHRSFRATITGLNPGHRFAYNVLRNKKQVFGATATARKQRGQPFRFALSADVGCNSEAQKEIAVQAYQANPDFIFLAGDIVYPTGGFNDYLRNFFPIYGASRSDPALGAPLLSSSVFISTVGNHDSGLTHHGNPHDLGKFPDALAFFEFWDLPLNGPTEPITSANKAISKGTVEQWKAFQTAAGARYPRMTTFSFDYGDSHWTVLDSNTYADWTDGRLQEWLRNDLKAAQQSRWKFVAFHHAPFSSAKKNFFDQRLRVIAPLLEEAKVDIVFSGNMHDYQRTYPLRFKPEKQKDGSRIGKDGNVSGRSTVDRKFDGRNHRKPEGIIYLISGAGGGALYGTPEDLKVQSWQPYTKVFNARSHSLTIVDVTDRTLTCKQVSSDGDLIDSFTVAKD